jgi:hypothetical protein
MRKCSPSLHKSYELVHIFPASISRQDYNLAFDIVLVDCCKSCVENASGLQTTEDALIAKLKCSGDRISLVDLDGVIKNFAGVSILNEGRHVITFIQTGCSCKTSAKGRLDRDNLYMGTVLLDELPSAKEKPSGPQRSNYHFQLWEFRHDLWPRAFVVRSGIAPIVQLVQKAISTRLLLHKLPAILISFDCPVSCLVHLSPVIEHKIALLIGQFRTGDDKRSIPEQLRIERQRTTKVSARCIENSHPRLEFSSPDHILKQYHAGSVFNTTCGVLPLQFDEDGGIIFPTISDATSEFDLYMRRLSHHLKYIFVSHNSPRLLKSSIGPVRTLDSSVLAMKCSQDKGPEIAIRLD